ncbi:proline racemase family protein [Neobacillus niacini]|uniref:proline racemase family protein n=1 Tax=Neobacillus niacini TaxID=86668 RepID=UPI00285C81C3|nr:proline racemase family protein [Neobacillus niacini]MDR7001956.1 proline racemase [Neobacillus niacini]
MTNSVLISDIESITANEEQAILPGAPAITRMISAIDSHTAGEAARIITGGIPNIPGKTMAEKRQYLIDHHDHLRTALMHEPRGHNEMFGAFLTAPTDPNADFGIIFMDGGGYLNMCGHNTIAAVTVAIETGMVETGDGRTAQVVLDTPAGLVRANASIKDGRKVEEVSFKNVPSFLYKKDQKLYIPEIGEVTFDISFGGSFFVIISAKELGLKVEPKNASLLTSLGMKVLQAVNANIEIQHPTLKHINKADLIEIFDDPIHPDATYKNVVIFGQGQVDRSPCGTGTSAKLATLYARGELGINEPFVYESILGTLFKGRIVEETTIGEFTAVVPEITGSAYITGYNTFLIDPEDPLKYGFILK